MMTDSNVVTEGTETDGTDAEEGTSPILANIIETRKSLQPTGKTTIFEVPGYKGQLFVEYRFIDTDAIEQIVTSVRRETRNQNGRGSTFLSSMDTLIAACRRIVIPDPKWKQGMLEEERYRTIDPEGEKDYRFDSNLATLLQFRADTPRETVMGLFGSGHAITMQNVMLSQWLNDVTRESDEDFLL